MLEGQLNEQLLQTVTLELRDTLWSLQLWMDGSAGKKKANLVRTLQVCNVAYIYIYIYNCCVITMLVRRSNFSMKLAFIKKPTVNDIVDIIHTLS